MSKYWPTALHFLALYYWEQPQDGGNFRGNLYTLWNLLFSNNH